MIFFKLLFAHCLADWSCLQPERMAKYKSRKEPTPCGAKNIWWPYWLTAHSIIYGGVLWFAYQNIVFAVSVAIAHWIIDFLKCEGKIDIHQDQVAHALFVLGFIIGDTWFVG